MEEISEITLHYISGRQIKLAKQDALDILSGKTIEAASRQDAMENKTAPREPLEITPKTVNELKEDSLGVKFVDYYVRYPSGTNMKTMTIEDFKRLYPDTYKSITENE